MEKISLQHPKGKKAINMDQEKYEKLKKALLGCLNGNSGITHKELFKLVTEDFKKSKIKFEGSLEWYLEWVKLDLEAKKEIKRIGEFLLLPGQSLKTEK